MDPIPATNSSSSSNSFKHHLSCGSSSSNSSLPKRQQSDDVPKGLMNDNSSSFKQFDIVANCPDHHFTENTKPTNVWTKKIQQDWKILEKDLPKTIFVRVFEERMDLLRAVIVGPAGTPYQDGLFFFDFQYTANYPNEPPKAYYHSGGLRPNPNLYSNGTVCLSLLNTWTGKDCEKWDPKRSTMLQILVSIQGLVLNAKPYFNEPGFAKTSNTHYGEKKSLAYNESTFLLSCKTMIYSLRKPPKHFEELVTYHFHKHGLNILMACRAYSNGTQVACVVGEIEQDVIEGTRGCSKDFQTKMKKLIPVLLKEFKANGVDCNKILSQKSNDGDMSAHGNATHRNVRGADSKKKIKAIAASAFPNEVSGDAKYVTLEEVAMQDMENATGAVMKGKIKVGGAVALSREANSNLKRLCRYLLKLGKKVLPIEN